MSFPFSSSCAWWSSWSLFLTPFAEDCPSPDSFSGTGTSLTFGNTVPPSLTFQWFIWWWLFPPILNLFSPIIATLWESLLLCRISHCSEKTGGNFCFARFEKIRFPHWLCESILLCIKTHNTFVYMIPTCYSIRHWMIAFTLLCCSTISDWYIFLMWNKNFIEM